MNNLSNLYPFFALLVPVIIGRYLLHQATEKLEPETKKAISQSVIGMQKLRLIAIFVIVGTLYFLPEASIVVFPLIILVMSWLYWQKISKLNPPKYYTQAFIASMALGIIGVAAFLYLSQGKII